MAEVIGYAAVATLALFAVFLAVCTWAGRRYDDGE